MRTDELPAKLHATNASENGRRTSKNEMQREVADTRRAVANFNPCAGGVLGEQLQVKRYDTIFMRN